MLETYSEWSSSAEGASGKSALAVELGEITELPVIELDKIFWQGGLVATPRDQWTAIQRCS